MFSSFHCLNQRALHATETTNSIPGAVDGVCFHNDVVRHGLAVKGAECRFLRHFRFLPVFVYTLNRCYCERSIKLFNTFEVGKC